MPMFPRMSENDAREALACMLEHFTPRHLRALLEEVIKEENGALDPPS